jgi:hypothetical protein
MTTQSDAERGADSAVDRTDSAIDRTADSAIDRTRDVDAEAPPMTTNTMCGPMPDLMEGCVLASDGALVTTPVVGTMIVAAVEEVPAGACRFTGFDITSIGNGDVATRLALDAGDGTRRTLVIRLPGLTAALFQVGETIDLSLDALVGTAAFSQIFNQTIAVTRGGKPVFVASTLHRGAALSLPDWTALGIDFVDEGAACVHATLPICTFYEHSLRISYAGTSKSMQVGQTGTLSNLNFAVEHANVLVSPNCDAPSFTQIGGFWSPSAP